MKYKDWLEQQRQIVPPDIDRGNPIYCPDCGRLVAYDRDYMFMVLESPIVCPDCDEIVIMPNFITYTSGTQDSTSNPQTSDSGEAIK